MRFGVSVRGISKTGRWREMQTFQERVGFLSHPEQQPPGGIRVWWGGETGLTTANAGKARP